MSIAFNSIPLFIDGLTEDGELHFQTILRSSFDTNRRAYFSISNLFKRINDSTILSNEQKAQIAFEISKAEYILGIFPFTIYPMKNEVIPYWTNRTIYDQNILYNELIKRSNTEERMNYLYTNGYRHLVIFEELFKTLKDIPKPNLLNMIAHFQHNYPNLHKIYLEHSETILSYEKEKDFTTRQLMLILIGFNKGLTNEQVAFFANPNFKPIKMKVLCDWISSLGITDELKHELEQNYHPYQIAAIKRCIDNSVPPTEIDLLRNKELSSSAIRCICKALVSDNLSSSQITRFLDPKYNDEQREQIELAIAEGLPPEQLDLIENENFNSHQMRSIRQGFLNGLDDKQVNFYANHDIQYTIMDEIKKGFVSGLTFEQVMLYARPELTASTMRSIRYCLQNNYCTDKFLHSLYYLSNMQLCNICLGIDSGLTNEQLDTYVDKPLYYSQVKSLIQKFKAYNASLIESKIE